MIAFRSLLIGLIAAALSACSSMEPLVDVPKNSAEASLSAYDLSLHQRSIHLFDPINLQEKVLARRLEEQVENIVLVLDRNLSSSEIRGVPAPVYLNEIVRRFAKTMPQDAFNILLVANDQSTAPQVSKVAWTRDTGAILNSLEASEQIPVIAGDSLDVTLESVYRLLNEKGGASSIVLFSEWDRIDSATVDAVARLQQYTGSSDGESIRGDVSGWDMNRVQSPSCLHLVGLNNYLSRSRASLGTCGLSKASDAISQPADMAAFVEQILYRGPMDSDNDGVFDYMDQCPDTPAGRIIDFSGCLKFSSMAE